MSLCVCMSVCMYPFSAHSFGPINMKDTDRYRYRYRKLYYLMNEKFTCDNTCKQANIHKNCHKVKQLCLKLDNYYKV